MAGDLARAGLAVRSDDQLIAVEPDPDPGVDQLVGHQCRTPSTETVASVHPPFRAYRDPGDVIDSDDALIERLPT